MKRSRLFLLLPIWAGLAWLPLAQAHDGPRGGEDHGRPSTPLTPLGFAETQRVLSAVKPVVRALVAGDPVSVRTPQGGRLAVPFLYQGQVVAQAFLGRDGTLAPMRLPRGDDDEKGQGTADPASLKAQLAGLTVSGAVQATPGEYRVTLLSGGRPVAALRLDRRTLLPKPDPGLLGRPVDPSRPPRP